MDVSSTERIINSHTAQLLSIHAQRDRPGLSALCGHRSCTANGFVTVALDFQTQPKVFHVVYGVIVLHSMYLMYAIASFGVPQC